MSNSQLDSNLFTDNETSFDTPEQVATKYLTDPKEKLTNRVRKKMQRVREKQFVSTRKPKDGLTKLLERLDRLTVFQLVRRIKQAARYAAGCKYDLDQLEENSVLRVKVEEKQKQWITVLKAAQKTLNSRQNAHQA